VRRLAKELHAAAGLPFLVVDVGDDEAAEDAAARLIDALGAAVAV
jgi:hypothetical protein